MGVIKNISLRLAYDGTEFYGFQRQSSLPSVQQHVEEALSGIYGRNIDSRTTFKRVIAAYGRNSLCRRHGFVL